MGCAAALAALKTLSDPGFQRTLRQETIPALWTMLGGLRGHRLVGEVRGRGMMAGLELVADQTARTPFAWEQRMGHRVVLAARERGVNLRAIGDLVLCVPALTIARDEIALLGRVLREALESVAPQ